MACELPRSIAIATASRYSSPGDDYWTEQTLADVAVRYPGIDMAPYQLGV